MHNWDVNWNYGTPVQRVVGRPGTVGHVFADNAASHVVTATALNASNAALGTATRRRVEVEYPQVKQHVYHFGNALGDPPVPYREGRMRGDNVNHTTLVWWSYEGAINVLG